MGREHGSVELPNFDDTFLDSPPFNENHVLPDEVYRELCKTAYHRIYLGALNGDTRPTHSVRLAKNSIAAHRVKLLDGTLHTPELLTFHKADVIDYGTAYGFELFGKPKGQNVPSLLRYSFVCTPQPTAVYIYPNGMSLNDELLRTRFIKQQESVINQLMTAPVKSRDQLPPNTHGGIIFSLRLIREYLRGSMNDIATGAAYSPPLIFREKAERYNVHPNTVVLSGPRELPDSHMNLAGWTEAQWRKNWNDLVVTQLEDDIIELRQRLRMRLSAFGTEEPLEYIELDPETSRLTRLLKFKIAHREALFNNIEIPPTDIPQNEM